MPIGIEMALSNLKATIAQAMVLVVSENFGDVI